MSLESPNYYSDRVLYQELLGKPNEKLTEQEKEFIKDMYHMEEYAIGLDGDH